MSRLGELSKKRIEIWRNRGEVGEEERIKVGLRPFVFVFFLGEGTRE